MSQLAYEEKGKDYFSTASSADDGPIPVAEAEPLRPFCFLARSNNAAWFVVDGLLRTGVAATSIISTSTAWMTGE